MQKILLVTTIFSMIPIICFAQSHCKADEFVVISGKVGKLNDNKVVSLCADKATPPFSKLSYRFGPINKVEMEYSGLFYSTTQQPLPRALLDVIYFRKGNFTYAVTECSGMHCGLRQQSIQLQVFDHKKRIVTLDSEPEKFDLKIELSDIKGKVVTQKSSDLDFDIELK